MDINFNCDQIETLINYYLDGRLAPSLSEFVKKHLDNCPKCKKKFANLNNSLNEYNYSKNKSSRKEPDKELITSLSAYMDNELDTIENIKIKKIAISNPSARQKLESMYKFQKLIHSAYEKTKGEIKYDYSKNIVSALNESPDYTTTYFRNIAVLFIFTIVAIICGFLYLYF